MATTWTDPRATERDHLIDWSQDRAEAPRRCTERRSNRRAPRLAIYVYMTREQMEERRLQAVPLIETGVSVARIAARVGVSRMTAHRWREEYMKAGTLRAKKAGRPKAAVQ
jgi:DNA invertase Pin-like site-specific DNA recombinase